MTSILRFALMVIALRLVASHLGVVEVEVVSGRLLL